MLVIKRDAQALRGLINFCVGLKEVGGPRSISVSLADGAKITLKLPYILLEILYTLILIGRVRLLKVADLAQ